MIEHDDDYHEGSGLSPEELYINHLGAVDNFTETEITAPGTATPDAAIHSMVLDTTNGVGLAVAKFKTKLALWTLSTKPLILTVKVLGLQNGDSGAQGKEIGFQIVGSGQGMQFTQQLDLSWTVDTGNAGGSVSTAISNIANNDILEIIATSSKIIYYVNGTIVATHTTYIPTAALLVMTHVYKGNAGMVAANQMSIDYMAVRRIL